MRQAIAIILLAALPAACFGKDGKTEGGVKPAKVTVPVGGTGYLLVKIDRETVSGPVSVALAGLPPGVTAIQPKLTLKANQEQAEFTLRSAADVQPGDYKAKVVITGNHVTQEKTVTVQIQDFRLNAAGWVAMLLSVSGVLLLCGFCVWRVLMLPPVEVEETLKGPLEIDTRDTTDAD